MMKKVIAVLLTLMMLLAVVCGCNDEPAESSNPEQGTSSVAESTDDNSSEDSTSSEETESSNLDSDLIDMDSAGTSTVPPEVDDVDTEPTDTDNQNGSSEAPDSEDDGEVPLRETLRAGVNFSCLDSGSGVKDKNKYIYDRSYYDLVADAGFDHIRFPVGMGPLVVSDGPEYLLDNASLRYLDVAINNAINAGLVIILDNHHNSQYTDREKFVRIWEQLAERYRYYPEQLMFELVNEPTAANISDNELNETQMEAVAAIRKTNPTRTIVLAPNEWNGYWKLWSCQIPSYLNENGQIEHDENVMLSVHCYNPMSFSHQGMNDNQKNVHWNDSMKASITSALEICADYETRTGRPVWLSEWGAYQGGHDAACRDQCMASYYKHFTSECARLGIAYAVWEFNSGFGVFDNNTKDFKSYILDNMVITW